MEPLRKRRVQAACFAIIFGCSFCFQKSSNFLPREPVTDIERLTLVVSRLIELIDEHGLSTDGIYRKSGTFSKVKRLRRKVQKIINNAKGTSNRLNHFLLSEDEYLVKEIF
jgi:hypothetical protein